MTKKSREYFVRQFQGKFVSSRYFLKAIKVIVCVLTFIVPILGLTSRGLADGPLSSWTVRESQTSQRLFGITFRNNMFVAVGANGTILTSPDGTSWTNRTMDNRPLLDKVAYGNGVFVVVGQEIDTGGVGHGVVLTSLDGLNWTPTTKLGTDISLNCIAFGKGTFVTAGETVVYHPGEPHVPMWASQDGVNWIPVQLPIELAAGAPRVVIRL